MCESRRGLWRFAGSEMVGIKELVCLLTSGVEGEFREGRQEHCQNHRRFLF
jgi:hypothetical protein